MSPLRHAVRLVDHEQRDVAALQRGPEAGGGEPLRRAEHDLRLARADLRERLAVGLLADRGREHHRPLPRVEQPPMLVDDQRHQRTDHDGQRLRRERRQLIAEALATARRHHDERVATVERRLHRVALGRPELAEPELGEQVLRRELGADPDLTGAHRRVVRRVVAIARRGASGGARLAGRRSRSRNRGGIAFADAIERAEQRQRPLTPVREVAPDRPDELSLLGGQAAELPARPVEIARRKRIEHLRQGRRSFVGGRQQLPQRRQQLLLLGRQIRPCLARLLQREHVTGGSTGEGGQDTMHGSPTLPPAPVAAHAFSAASEKSVLGGL